MSVDKEVKVAETTILQKETTDQSEGEETIEKMAASDLTEVPALESRYILESVFVRQCPKSV